MRLNNIGEYFFIIGGDSYYIYTGKGAKNAYFDKICSYAS